MYNVDRNLKSAGHIGFNGEYEYFEVGTAIYRVKRNNHMGSDGMRVGARFESYGHGRPFIEQLCQEEGE